ncbi:MAG: STAS domain-containing protein [SAR324 cluster bacterium]|nr:STAS domain-containing protein [SAR324 cluster bacterium]
MNLEINHKIQGDVFIISPVGELAGGPSFTKLILIIENDGLKKVVLNGAQINFIDSSGIGSIIDLFRTLHEKGCKLCLCELQQDVLDLLTMSGMDSFLPIYKTEMEAAGSM